MARYLFRLFVAGRSSRALQASAALRRVGEARPRRPPRPRAPRARARSHAPHRRRRRRRPRRDRADMTAPSLSGEAARLPAGIPGFDVIAGGGLPRQRATLVAGTAGSAKTIFA